MSTQEFLNRIEKVSCDLENAIGVTSLLTVGVCNNASLSQIAATCHVVLRELERCKADVDGTIDEFSKISNNGSS